MNIIARGSILYYISKYPPAKTALLTWYVEFSKQLFKNFNELKSVYGSASLIGSSRVVFNIKGNEFRLLTSVNFKQGAAYIIWFGTHATYDRTDMATVVFDPRILDFKPPKT
ncbi:MAG: type II toxin-antitoxin system HigB family toxin [Bacteroidetes bacterium]|nr:type II toxin-antitoxin system HigB family toxin [Bacteroidota bacterium]